MLAVKDTKAINQSPSVQSSSSSKLPPSSGLDLLVHADHLLTIQSLWSARVLQMICSWDWEKRLLGIFSNDSVLSGTWPQHFNILKNNQSFHYQMLSFPISKLPTGQGRVEKCNLFLIEWIINYYRDPCNISWYSSWAGSVENAQSHLLSRVHKVYDGIVLGPVKKKNVPK